MVLTCRGKEIDKSDLWKNIDVNPEKKRRSKKVKSVKGSSFNLEYQIKDEDIRESLHEQAIQPTSLTVLGEPIIIEEEQNNPTRVGVDLIEPNGVDKCMGQKINLWRILYLSNQGKNKLKNGS